MYEIENPFPIPKRGIFLMHKAASAAALRQAQGYGETGKGFR
jgi:hypothetical protein